MNLVIDPCVGLHGTAKIPPNKSHSFRALIMAGLADGESKIVAPAVSNDWMFATEALEMFGASVEPHAGNVWEVQGTGGKLRTPTDVINCGNSGIILRFFTALAGCCDGYTVLTGDHSLRHIRPMNPLVEAMNQLGAWAVCTKGDGHAPMVVRGRLGGGRAELEGADSQFVSGLLIASCLADAPTELIVRNPGEKPWVGVTLNWLDRVGAEYSNENFEHYRVRGQSRWAGFEYTVPRDWSGALYPIVAALITPNSEVRVPDMDMNDPQGDKRVVDVLREMGGRIEMRDGCLVARTSRLTGRTIDCNDFIDQLPVLAVVGTVAEGETTLTNASICRGKECDRIKGMYECLTAMGADVEEREDGLVVRKSTLQGARLSSYQDHRMVMSMTVAALVAGGRTIIEDCDCVKKTFARFPEQMMSLGAEIRKE
ncbi:MAG: 3-phosphoshikimate 1-carboxyvinyltransferase [Phycisphaerae bacterium]|nr:3-phosphoshikimate 1-carboxyvinyltransferase [Phycisphaerae bacterium]